MGKPQTRMGDISNHGGKIITGAIITVENSIPVARMGDFHACPIHGVTPIVCGSLTTITEGKPNARMGDSTACGAKIITGSLDTIDG